LLASIPERRRNAALLCGFVGLVVFVSGCSEAAPANPNRVPESNLAPRFLEDRHLVEAYLAKFPSAEYEVAEVPGLGRFYIDDNPALVKRELAAGRPWEPEAKAVMATHTVEGSTVLDIGAHIGSHAVTLAKLVGPHGAVYSFEPQVKIYRELVKNLELNGLENVIPLRFAVGAENGLVFMTPTGDFDGRMFVGEGGDKVELRTIDSFGFKNVSLMKIDVEGFELEVLKGAEETIRTWHPAIIIEITAFFQFQKLPPKGKRLVEGVVKYFKRMNYEFEYFAFAGEPQFLARYVGKL